MRDACSGIAQGDFAKLTLNAGAIGMAYTAGAAGGSKISQSSGAKSAMIAGATMNSMHGDC